MPVITAQKLYDLLATTTRNFGKGNFTEIATDLQDYPAFRELILGSRAEQRESSGQGFQWDVMVNHSGSAQNVGIGAPDSVELVDTMVQATADWRGTTANWGIFEEEISMNTGDERIVELATVRDIACRISVAERMESNFWGPPVALSDEVTPWGVNTWLVKNATEGFNGGAPSGYTTIGLNPTTYPRWKNYTAQYTTLTEDDGIDKWMRAARKTNFKPIVNAPTFSGERRYGFYVNEPTIATLERYLRGANENLGVDIAKFQGEVMFNRVPVVWVPKLDADTTNPIYGIPWQDMKTMILKGWWHRQTFVAHYPGYHTLGVYFKDYRYQFVMRNRRSGFVMATGTTYPS